MEALTLHCKGGRVKEAEIKKAEQHFDGGRSLPTIAEVARLATVSTATVSRVVNGSPNVRPATRDAVLGAIDELGYTPNRAARTLVTRRTDTIALVVSESETRVFSDPFFPSIVRGVSAALAHTELQLLLLMARDDREHAKVERYVRQGHVDGVILMSLHGDDPLPKTLPRLGVPTVLVGRPKGDERLPWVDADNRGGARAATAQLLAGGRKSVATITGPLDMSAKGVSPAPGPPRSTIDSCSWSGRSSPGKSRHERTTTLSSRFVRPSPARPSVGNAPRPSGRIRGSTALSTCVTRTDEPAGTISTSAPSTSASRRRPGENDASSHAIRPRLSRSQARTRSFSGS